MTQDRVVATGLGAGGRRASETVSAPSFVPGLRRVLETVLGVWMEHGLGAEGLGASGRRVWAAGLGGGSGRWV